MSEDTQALNVTMNAELEKAIKAATDPVALRQAILAEAERQATLQQQAVADKAAADAATTAAVTAAATTEAAKGYSRVENIGGRDFEFSGADKAEVDQLILNAYRVAYTVREDTATEAAITVVDPAVEAANAVAAAEAAAVAKADLETKFKRGEITAADYIEQSGAMKEYLEKQGLPIEALRATVEQAQNHQDEQSWADASDSFLHSSAGQDWPGGENNKNLIGLKVAELGLVDSKDKVAALAQAWAAMKSTGMVFPQGNVVDPAVQAAADAARAAAAASATATAAAAATAAPAPVAAAAPAPVAKTPAGSSSLFGASSGVGAGGGNGAGATERAVAPQITITKDTTPAEIIAAWKEGMLAQGKDPNAAFTEAFSSRRA